MVTGIERWKEYFNDYKDKYVLIGGAACNLLEEELDIIPKRHRRKMIYENMHLMEGMSGK